METADGPGRSRWRRYELRTNLAGAAASLVLLIAGIGTGKGLLAGPGLLLLVFFCVYSVYARVRRDL